MCRTHASTKPFKPQRACKHSQHMKSRAQGTLLNGETGPTTPCEEALEAGAAHVKCARKVEIATVEASYLSESSARSSVRSRSPSMMTSLRATFRCSASKCYNSTGTSRHLGRSTTSPAWAQTQDSPHALSGLDSVGLVLHYDMVISLVDKAIIQ